MHVARSVRILLPLLPALALVALALALTPASFAAPPRLPASIQDQINAAPDGGTVVVADGTYNETLLVTKNLTLTGASSTTAIIQAPISQRVILVTAGHNLNVQSLTIRGGHVPGGVGGGIYITGGDLRIGNSWLNGNSADYGGAIFAEGAANRVDVTGSRIELNAATYHGGGLFVRGAIALTDTQVLTNVAGHHGGGLHTDVGRTDLYGGMFAFNSAGTNDNGGGVNVNNAITISGTQFYSNTSARDGGAVLQWNAGQPVVVTNARFERNTARRDGGGLWAHGDLTVTGSVFISNTADSHNTTNTHGGGLYLNGGTVAIISSTFTANSIWCVACFPLGGGAYLMPTGTGLVQGSRFEGNYGWNGGGIGADTGAALLVRQSTFAGNSAGYGGGMRVAEAAISDTDFTGNWASNSSGALQAGYTVTLTSVRFISNSTTGFEGPSAAWLGSSVQAVNVLFAGNSSLQGSGAALWLNGQGARTMQHVTLAYPGQGTGSAIRITGGTLNITNSIIASYSVGISNSGGTVIAPYDLFAGGIIQQTDSGGSTTIGPNTVNADPRFVNPAGGDYHLRAGSPAIGAGANLGVATDLDGRPRLGRYDLGAYQFWTSLFLPLIRR